MAAEGQRLKRELGVAGAVLLGLGSMVGTGVFVSLGLAAGYAGPMVTVAVLLAAGVAHCNALNSAQLAASCPVSGGTYEYGYRYLSPALGFTAGWLFLAAKSASAATAALGFAGYIGHILGWDRGPSVALAVAAVAVVTAVVAGGVRRSNQANAVIVGITLLALVWFVVASVPVLAASGTGNWIPLLPDPGPAGEGGARGLLHAVALLFVAYTGYGRVATCGEEVIDPARTIPRAIWLTVGITALLYLGVAIAAIGTVGATTYYQAARGAAAPLADIAGRLALPGGGLPLALGAVTAMLGVLLNLILGLSRVLLAMGRRGDMPAATARLNAAGTTPMVAVATIGVVVALLALSGRVTVTWSFSAVTVLVYYALTNLAALALPAEHRLYPRWLGYVGLASCGFLALWVGAAYLLAGAGLVAVGLVWHAVARRRAGG